MKYFWNQRYAEDSFAYGTLPNVFFKQELDKLAPGFLLLPAEGEGRNATYAASKGWEVSAFDFSASAMKKALELAKHQDVHLDFHSDKKFDVLGLFYVHFSTDIRVRAHQHLLQFLKPNGTVIF